MYVYVSGWLTSFKTEQIETSVCGLSRRREVIWIISPLSTQQNSFRETLGIFKLNIFCLFLGRHKQLCQSSLTVTQKEKEYTQKGYDNKVSGSGR